MFGSSYEISRVHGIPIRVHITLLVFLPVMAMYFSERVGLPLLLSAGIMALFFCSVALHELGHALIAMREGCGVRQILLLPIGGVAELSHIPDRPAAEIKIAVAGPIVSLGIAIITGLVALGFYLLGMPLLFEICAILSAVNTGLSLFNLLPSFPMDGGRVLRAYLSRRLGRLEATRIAARIGQGMAGLFLLIGLVRLDFVLVAIAIFIFFAARSEDRFVRWENIRSRHPGIGGAQAPPLATEDVVVGPPPFAPRQRSKTATPLRSYDSA
jgi:Zn-dependent protease